MVALLNGNVAAGGFGSSVLEYMNENSIKGNVKVLGLPDKFIEHGHRSLLLKKYGLTGPGIAATVEGMLKR